MFPFFLNVVQGLLAGLVFLGWRQGWSVSVAFICFGLNAGLSILLTKLEWGDDPKGTARELIELGLELVLVFGGLAYIANEFGKGFLGTDTPAFLGLCGLLICLVNWGAIISGILRGLAWCLDLLSGYRIEDIFGGFGE